MRSKSTHNSDASQNDGKRDKPAHCASCSAVCCRLIVVLGIEDNIPPQYTTHLPDGHRVMERGKDGWCVAMDRNHMNCSIYENRPSACRRFVMGGPYCDAVRFDFTRPTSPDSKEISAD